MISKSTIMFGSATFAGVLSAAASASCYNLWYVGKGCHEYPIGLIPPQCIHAVLLDLDIVDAFEDVVGQEFFTSLDQTVCLYQLGVVNQQGQCIPINWHEFNREHVDALDGPVCEIGGGED